MRAVVLGLLAACGDNISPFEQIELVQVTAQSPFGSCSPTIAGGAAVGYEVEPMVAIDPTDPMHVVGAWQQDRSAFGGAAAIGTAASFDGGRTWQLAYPHASRCGGGTADKTTDPWVTFAADGTAYLVALSFEGNQSSVLAFGSPDGGASWGEPATLAADDDPDVFNDKEAVTGDPDEPGRLYVVWDRLTGTTMPTKPIGTGPGELARMASHVWEPARPIFDPGIDAQTIGNIVVVLPDSALVDVAMMLTMNSSTNPHASLRAVRSTDHGTTWTAPFTIVADVFGVGVADPNRPSMGVRSGQGLPSVAVDRTTGQIYVAWEDSRFGTGTEHDSIALSTSVDGGVTWSPPVQVDASDAPAFGPQVAVTDDGTVGVLYYDTREGDPADATAFLATAWLATSADHGATWTDTSLTRAFDLRDATIGSTYFLGDYQGLVTSGNAFVPFFAGAGPDGTNIFVRPVPR